MLVLFPGKDSMLMGWERFMWSASAHGYDIHAHLAAEFVVVESGSPLISHIVKEVFEEA